jgi:hypothetical protein
MTKKKKFHKIFTRSECKDKDLEFYHHIHNTSIYSLLMYESHDQGPVLQNFLRP